jgi:hypothetical protein
LQLVLVEPKQLHFRIQGLRDRESDLTSYINDLLLKQGTSRKALDEAWASIAARVAAAKQQVRRDANETDPEPLWKKEDAAVEAASRPITETEKYACYFQDWLALARHHLWGWHEYETEQARSIKLIFELRNEGTAHAKDVEARIMFPPFVKEPKSHPRNLCDLEELPHISQIHSVIKSLKRYPSPRPTTTRHGSQFIWYQGKHPEERRQPWGTEEFGRFTFPYSQPDASLKLSFTRDDVPHGSIIKFIPLVLTIGDSPSEEIDLSYRLHASNQPVDNIGGFLLKIEIVYVIMSEMRRQG